MNNLNKIKEVLTMAKISGLAYLDKQTAVPEFHKLGFSEVKFISKNGTQVYILKKLGHIVVAFRGTQVHEIEDILADLKYQHVPFGIGEVHEGFNGALLEVYQEVFDTIFDMQLNYEKVSYTGHSLGGALATLCSLKIQYQCAIKDVEVVTFGSPRVGCDLFMKAFNQTLKGKCIRVVNDEDIVPKLPTNSFMNYAHVDDLYFLCDKHTFKKVPSYTPYIDNLCEYVKDRCGAVTTDERIAFREYLKIQAKELVTYHSIDSYIDSLEKVIKAITPRRIEIEA